MRDPPQEFSPQRSFEAVTPVVDLSDGSFARMLQGGVPDQGMREPFVRLLHKGCRNNWVVDLGPGHWRRPTVHSRLLCRLYGDLLDLVFLKDYLDFRRRAGSFAVAPSEAGKFESCHS